MGELNRRAMGIARDRLVGEIKEASEAKRAVLAERESRYGKGRVFINGYLENISLPELFGFDMNDYYADPLLSIEADLRHRLFWLDNSLDDGIPNLGLSAASMYYDMTLFGLTISYSYEGIPTFGRHPMEDSFDMGCLRPFDFYSTGEMPMVHRRYESLRKASEELYGGELDVWFPRFYRGPLDVAIQLRGYQNFAVDCVEDTERVCGLMSYIVSERKRYNDEADAFLGTAPSADPTTFVADDWINVPFISPDAYDRVIGPAYSKVQENEGKVTGFHTCGEYGYLTERLLGTFPHLRSMDVSGWNDVRELDAKVDRSIPFNKSYINSFIVGGSDEEHAKALGDLREVAKVRRVGLGVGAIVKVLGTIDDSIEAMNRFIVKARDILYS